MSFDYEMLQSIAAICKYLYKNPNTHKNTVRKELVGKGKIATKEFAKTLESLIALGKVSVEKDNVSLCRDFVKTGVMQKQGNDFFVVLPGSKKHYKVSKSVASGFSAGDILDFMVEINGSNQEPPRNNERNYRARLLRCGMCKAGLTRSLCNDIRFSPRSTRAA